MPPVAVITVGPWLASGRIRRSGVCRAVAVVSIVAGDATTTRLRVAPHFRILMLVVQFDTWLDDLHLYLLSDSRDSVSLFDHTSHTAPTPPTTADSATRSQWLTLDTAARLAIRNHLPLVKCAHFRQHRTAQALYDAVLACYSSLATAALGRLLLPYLFPELSAFATVEDLVSHLRTSDARYHAAAPAEFLDMNQPPMFITICLIVTRLPDSLRSDRYQFLSLHPTVLTVDLLEQHLLAAETSAVAVGAARGTPRTPFFEGMSRLLLLVRSATAARARVAGVVAVVAGVVVGAAIEVVEAVEVVAVVGVVAGVGALVATMVAAVGVAVVAAVGVVVVGLELLSMEVLAVARGSSSSVGARPRRPSSFVSGFLSVGHLEVVVAAQFVDEAERPCWAELLRSGVAIFDLDYDSILAAMYALSASAEGDRYLCVPPDPDIEAAALGAGESALPGTARSEALHTLTLDSGQVAPPCSCRLLSHQNLLWHNCLGHPSLPRHCGMHSRLLVSGLPRSLPPLPPSPAPPCLPCVEGRQRVAPHSSSFPPTTAPLQTLHMDVWGPARVSRQGRERYFLLVGDDYTRYTTVFPLSSKGQGLLQSFTLPDSPQQNGIAERRIGLVIEVARTSMIHAAAPHFLWLFAVRYAAHQLKLWPRVSLPKTSLTLCWTGEAGDASVFRGLAPSCVSQVDPLPGTVPVEVALDSGAARSAASGGAASRGVEPGDAECEGTGSRGAEPGGAEPAVVKSGGAEPGGAESGGAEPWGPTSFGGGADASPRLSPRPEPLSPQQLREWFTQRTRLRRGAAGAGDFAAGDTGAGGAGVTAEAGGTEGAAAAGPRSGDPTERGAARAGGARARAGGAGGAGDGGVGAGAGGTGVGGAGTGGAGAVDTGAGGAGAGGAVSRGAGAGAGGTVRPRPYFVPLLGKTSGLSERREPASRPASPIRTGRRVPRPRPPPVPGTHAMALRPSSVPLRFPLPLPHESSLLASPTVSRLLATVVTGPSFESTAASALVAELVDFAAACRLEYATALVAESVSASPPSVGGECALGTDVLEDKQKEFECLAAAIPRFASMLLAPEGDPNAQDIPTPRSYAEAITGLYSSKWQAAMDAEMASWKSTGTYLDAFPPSRANIVDGMWIFRVKRPPGSPPAFKARYVARGFSQRQGVDYFHTFSPTLKMTTLRVFLHVAAQRDYEFHSVDFSTAFLQSSLHEEIWLRRPPSFTGSFPAGTLWSLRRPVYSLRQAPHEWHDTLRTALAALRFTPSTADPPLILCTDMSLPLFYVLVCEAEIYAGAMAAQELRWLTYLLTDLGEQPRLARVVYVDNKAMIALCQEHILEHRTKHIALRYFLARELQQRGQLRLAYVATRANTADIFTVALPPGDHQRFSTVLGVVPTLPHLLIA
ncbi:unnamed protein product [Closterium sp. NIES-54]